MNKSLKLSTVALTLFALLFVGVHSQKALARPQAPQYPILNAAADKIIQKYQASSCEQLWEKKSQKAPPTPAEQRAIQLLHGDPQMRAAFINKVAAPIANKMFDCGLIP